MILFYFGKSSCLTRRDKACKQTVPLGLESLHLKAQNDEEDLINVSLLTLDPFLSYVTFLRSWNFVLNTSQIGKLSHKLS